MSDELVLNALDGSNPLAFLAALGTLRLLSLETRAEMEMAWERRDGFWRPKLRPVPASREGLCEKLAFSTWWAPAVKLVEGLGNNITVPVKVFQPFVNQACETAHQHDRRTADFAAALGSEVCEDENKNRIETTDICFITGSGRQDFLGTALTLSRSVTPGHIYDALFGEWVRQKGLSMRWDPADAAEYALQWGAPTDEGASAVWGANRLAFEALPYFPTAPMKSGMQTVRLQTTGLSRRNHHDEFTWPIWQSFIGATSVRYLLSLSELQEDRPERSLLASMGVGEIYRAQRVSIGQGPKRKVNFRPARAL